MMNNENNNVIGKWMLDQSVVAKINQNLNLISEYNSLKNDLTAIIDMLTEQSGNMNNCYELMKQGVKDT